MKINNAEKKYRQKKQMQTKKKKIRNLNSEVYLDKFWKLSSPWNVS